MNDCATCVHWRAPVPHDHNALECIKGGNNTNPDMSYEVRLCWSPSQNFYSRPGRSESSVFDAEGYYAAMLTGPDFGCVNHSTNPADVKEA